MWYVGNMHLHGPTDDYIIVPVIPLTLHQTLLEKCHDTPSASHQGSNKTLDMLHKEAY